MLTANAKAASLAAEHARIIKFAAAKEWRKWSHRPSAERPFDAADFDQWALEAILIMGGVLRSTRHLQTLSECEGHEGWTQRNVDLYVRDKAFKAYRASRVIGRTADLYLDEPEGETGSATVGDSVLTPRDDTNPDSLIDIRSRFPLLYAQFITGEKQIETMRRLHIAPKTYAARRGAEMTEFHAWAVRNRRVVAGTEIPPKRGSGLGRWANRVAQPA